jgi:bifunctional DNA-binding transcriptional regulator/antitoxin component of YhaV-PrlF toxin-antitoxin module
MRSTAMTRGRTTVPVEIRSRYGIVEGDRLAWIDDGQVIRVAPLPKDPVGGLRGAVKGASLGEKLLQSRLVVSHS